MLKANKMEQECKNNETLHLLENINFSTEIAAPNLEQLKIDRNGRNNDFLNKLEYSNDSAPRDDSSSHNSIKLNNAAIRIQRVFRGFLGRRKYFNALYDAFVKEENDFYDQQELQTQEGEILIENYKIEREIEDTIDIDRNRSRFHHANASVIQRAWRSKQHSTKEKEHICCSCFDDFPELYEYYKNTNTICFCCDDHRNLTNKERFETLDPVSYLDTQPIESYVSNVSTLSLAYIDDDKPTNLVNPQVEFFNGKGNEFLELNRGIVENVTDSITKKYSVIEASKSVLKSLEKLQEKDCNREGRFVNPCRLAIHTMSLNELKDYIEKLEKDIADKNLELLRELMVRDDLFTNHEALMMDADDLTKQENKRRR